MTIKNKEFQATQKNTVYEVKIPATDGYTWNSPVFTFSSLDEAVNFIKTSVKQVGISQREMLEGEREYTMLVKFDRLVIPEEPTEE